MFSLLFTYHIRRWRRYFATKRAAKIATAGIFILIFLAVAAGMYFFMRAGFIFMDSDAFLRAALPLFVYELFLLVIFYLVFASAMITGLFQLFRGHQDEWVMASPAYAVIPPYILGKTFFASLWPLLVLALPALLAMHTVFTLTIAGALIAILSVFLLTVISVGAACVLLFAVSAFLDGIKKAHLAGPLSKGAIAALSMLLFAGMAIFGWMHIGTTDILETFGAHDLDAEAATATGIIERFRPFPSHFTALTFAFVQENRLGPAAVQLVRSLLFAAGILLFFLLLSRKYLPLWQALQETPSKIRKRKKHPHPFPRYMKSRFGALFEKEALMLVRNTRDIMWLAFLLFLWLAQTGANVFIKNNMRRYDIPPESIPDIIQAFQMVIVVYFVAAFVLRFAFPSFSMEKKTAWIIAGMPLRRERVFWGKFVFFAGTFTALAVTVGILNALILGATGASALISLLFIATAAITVTAYGTSLGAVFPNFETDDPQVLSTTIPGIAFILGALLYGAIGAAALYAALVSGAAGGLILFFAVSAAFCAFFLHISPRLFAKIEFV